MALNEPLTPEEAQEIIKRADIDHLRMAIDTRPNPKRRSRKVNILIFAPTEDECRGIKRLFDNLPEIIEALGGNNG